MIADPEDVDCAALEREDEQHIGWVNLMVSTLKKSVAKMPLAWAARNSFHLSPLRGARPPVAAKNPTDRARGDADPEPTKLALNANTSPAAVLPAEADDELDDLIAERGTSRTSLGSPPFALASRELPMPAQQV